MAHVMTLMSFWMLMMVRISMVCSVMFQMVPFRSFFVTHMVTLVSFLVLLVVDVSMFLSMM